MPLFSMSPSPKFLIENSLTFLHIFKILINILGPYLQANSEFSDYFQNPSRFWSLNHIVEYEMKP